MDRAAAAKAASSARAMRTRVGRAGRSCARRSDGRRGRSARSAGAHELAPVGEGFPRGDLVAPVQRRGNRAACSSAGCRPGMPVLVQQQVHAPRRFADDAGEARMRVMSASEHVELADLLRFAFDVNRFLRLRFESCWSSRLSNIFCVGCGRSGRLPSTEPRCAASSSRSRTCAPARFSAPSRRLLPLPVGPWITMKSSRKEELQLRNHESPVAL